MFTFLVFRVYHERPVVIDSLSLKLRRFSSNMILDEMSSAKYRLLFAIVFFFLLLFDCSFVYYCTFPLGTQYSNASRRSCVSVPVRGPFMNPCGGTSPLTTSTSKGLPVLDKHTNTNYFFTY